jgi:Cu/Zn superoxide dismutase
VRRYITEAHGLAREAAAVFDAATSAEVTRLTAAHAMAREAVVAAEVETAAAEAKVGSAEAEAAGQAEEASKARGRVRELMAGRHALEVGACTRPIFSST